MSGSGREGTPGNNGQGGEPSQGLLPIIGSSWTEIGPKPIQNGLGHFTWGTAPFSGRVSAIAVNASNPSIVYAGGAQGGVWKSTNGGSTWTPLMDSSPSLAVGAITISPDGKTLYVGTGEPNHSGDTYYGTGLLKSNNEGGTWVTLGSTVFTGSAISSVIINPANSNDLLVSTTWASCCMSLGFSQNPAGIGVFRSTDGGSTWSLALSGSSGVADLIADPNNSNVVYAGDFSGQVWRTADFGASWGTPILYYTSPGDQGRVAVALSGSLPNVIFAAFANQTGSLLGIFEYNITNSIVTSLGYPPDPPLLSNNTPCGPAGKTQCWYDLILSVDPTNPNILFFGGVDLYRSTDQGSTWTDLGGYTTGSAIHPDQHALVLSSSSPGTLWEGNDGGLWSSTNYGSSWTDRNNGLGLTQFQSIAASPTSSTSAIGGTQDNACVQYSGSLAWNELTSGDGGWTGYESANPNIMYCDYTNLNVYKSTNGGSSWSSATSGINLSDDSLFYAPVAQDPSNPGTLYIGGTHVYKTTNYASSWFDVSGSIGSAVITALGVAPSNSNYVYLGDMDGNLRVSSNGGSTWSTVAEAGPISSIAVNSSDYKVAYASLAGYATPTLLKTIDGGNSWQTLPLAGFPSASINVVKFDPVSGSVFLGTDSGAYYSANGGFSWDQLGSGLPNAAVFDIAFTRSDSILAATHGRGAWELPQPVLKHAQLTFSYAVNGGGSGYTAPVLSYVHNGIPKTVTLTSSPVVYTADYGTNWSVSRDLPGSSPTERWETHVAVVAGPAVSNVTTNFVYYHQYRQVVSYSVSDFLAIPGHIFFNATRFGVKAGFEVGGTPAGFFVDSGSAWSVTNPIAGGTGETWQINTNAQPASGTASSAQTFVFKYYHQYQVSFQIDVTGATGYSPPQITYISFGTNSTAALGTKVWADASAGYAFPPQLPGSSSDERWELASQGSGVVGGTGQITASYYSQYPLIMTLHVKDGGHPGSPSIQGMYLGQAGSAACTVSLLAFGNQTLCWLDQGSPYHISENLVNSSSTERWHGAGATGVLSSATPVSLTYYHQFYIDASYNVLDGGNPGSPILSYTFEGVPTTSQMSQTPSPLWMDANSWSAPATLPESSLTERWASPYATNGTLSSDSPITIAYYHQYAVTVSYGTNGGDMPPPPMNVTQFGDNQAHPNLSTTPTTYWLDSGSSWSVPRMPYSTNSQRWMTNDTTNVTVASASTEKIVYQHQYYVRVSPAATGGGTISPSSNWYDDGYKLNLTASPMPGWELAYWTGQGDTSYSGGANAQVSVGGAINETATFFPGLTLTVGSGGSVTYSVVAVQFGQVSSQKVIYVPTGTNVTLMANPSSFFYSFNGWGGLASGKATTGVVVNAPMTVEAKFGYDLVNIGVLAGIALAGVVGIVYYLKKRGGSGRPVSGGDWKKGLGP